MARACLAYDPGRLGGGGGGGGTEERSHPARGRHRAEDSRRVGAGLARRELHRAARTRHGDPGGHRRRDLQGPLDGSDRSRGAFSLARAADHDRQHPAAGGARAGERLEGAARAVGRELVARSGGVLRARRLDLDGAEHAARRLRQLLLLRLSLAQPWQRTRADSDLAAARDTSRGRLDRADGGHPAAPVPDDVREADAQGRRGSAGFPVHRTARRQPAGSSRGAGLRVSAGLDSQPRPELREPTFQPLHLLLRFRTAR